MTLLTKVRNYFIKEHCHNAGCQLYIVPASLREPEPEPIQASSTW